MPARLGDHCTMQFLSRRLSKTTAGAALILFSNWLTTSSVSLAVGHEVYDSPQNAASTSQIQTPKTSAKSVDDPRVSASATHLAPLLRSDSLKASMTLSILQIGDSHTAADYFTGEVRRILQARFGNGGPGYLALGKPHPGIRHTDITSTLSAGWTYSALQRSGPAGRFSLSGFSATASAPDETASLSAETAVPYNLIEVETWVGPGRGALEIGLDNVVCVQRNLQADRDERLILRVTAEQCRQREFKTLTIRTTADGVVTIDGIYIVDKSSGLVYSNVGFPGATIDIINKLDVEALADALRLLAPQIIVLSFGTNEGFKDDIDLNEYQEHYRQAIRRIRVALPGVKPVLILPPDAARLPPSCASSGVEATCEADPRQLANTTAEKDICIWRRPPKLDLIRNVERAIAQQENIPYWDWSQLMPDSCGAHVWPTERPLMAPDHIHFTQEGYKLGAQAFTNFLLPIIEKVKSEGPHN
jgi:lysophospholipase L1-like esterase